MYADRGNGARIRTPDGDREITANDRSDIVWIDGQTPEAADVIGRVLRLKRWYVWLFSSSVFYAHLAAGRISGIIHVRQATSEPPVHTAAGCLIASEAGAMVSNMETGEPWNLRTVSILAAATPQLHRDLSAVVRGDSGVRAG